MAKDYYTDYQEQAIKAAKDFNYGPEVIKKIKAAKTSGEISKIMTAARHQQEKESK